MSASLVAVPTYHLIEGRVRGWEKGGYGVPDRYVRALHRAGARPVLIAAPDSAPAAEILEPFDGLLLIGGGDIEPRRYDAVPHTKVYGTEPDRDELELKLAEEALAAGLPLFAICRGFQLLNVAVGGTLHQHLGDVAGIGKHGAPEDGGSTSHHVTVRAGSRLAKACDGADVIDNCTSHHHQGIDRLGDGLDAVGWSEDGLVEAVETSSGDGWVLGVQWHPEMSADDDPVQQGLFDAFVSQLRRA